MPQFMRPNVTLLTGTWFTIPGFNQIHQCIDDSVAAHNSDSDHISAHNDETTPCAVSFTTPTSPGTNNNHWLRFAVKQLGDTSAVNKQTKVQLRRIDNNSLLFDTDWIIPQLDTYEVKEYELPGSVMASAGGYANLGATIRINGLFDWNISAGDEIRYTALEIEVPHAPGIPMRDTKIGVNTLSKSDGGVPNVVSTKIAINILSSPPPKNFTSKYTINVLGSNVVVLHTKTGIQFLCKNDQEILRLTWLTANILFESPPVVVRESKIALNVLGQFSSIQVRETKIGVQLLAVNPFVDVRVSRIGIQILRKNVHQLTPSAAPDPFLNLVLSWWQDGMQIQASWSTAVTTSRTGAEERRGLVDRPFRNYTFPLVSLQQDEAFKLHADMMRMAHASVLWPLFIDYATVEAEASGSFITCETKYRRFFNNGWIMIHSWELDEMSRPRMPKDVQYVEIATVTDTGLSLKNPLSTTYPIGCRLYPCFEAEPVPNASISLVNRDANVASVSLQERMGKTALPPTIPNDEAFNSLIDGDVQVIDGLPVIPFAHHWESDPVTNIIGTFRRVPAGKGMITVDRMRRPVFAWDVVYMGQERRESWQILRFLDSRQGRLKVFWYVPPTTLWKLVDVQANHVDIEADVNLEDLQTFYDYVAVHYDDDTYAIEEISGVVATTFGGEPVLRISFVDAVVTTDVKRVTSGHLCRLFDDGYTESWGDHQRCTISTRIIERLSEQEIELEEL